MDQNLISVQIVAYNAQKTLRESLESVALQKDVLTEVVFVNDASTDGTLSVMQEFSSRNPHISCTILSNPTNQGITKSRNAALRASKGSYLAVLDSDDIWTSPTKLRDQLAFLNEHPDHVVVGTQMRIGTADGSIAKQTSYPTSDVGIRSSMLVFNQFCHSSILMRNLGQRYDENLYIWEDYDLLLSLGTKGSYANLDEPMVDYLYVPKKYSFGKRLKLISTELEIIRRYKRTYPNFALGYAKRILKFALTLLHLK